MDSYDAIVVGTRVAGAATAMLLAREGLRVLAVDQTRFPSDTLSTHLIQLPGIAALARWGILDAVTATGCPPTRDVRFVPGPVVLDGRYAPFDGFDAVFGPRRYLLDPILIDAARAAGAEIIEGFTVESPLFDGERVTGVRGTAKGPGGVTREFRARIVIGADGKHSRIARAVKAREYRTVPTASGAFYTYYSGLPMPRGEIHVKPDSIVTTWATNDGLTLMYAGFPVERFTEVKADPERHVQALLATCGELGDRVRAATREEPFRGSPDFPNVFRQPYGPGWALVGDAGLVMDPITGQGIGNALQDAEALATVIVAGLGGTADLRRGLARFHRRRDQARKPMYRMTTRLAAFGPDPRGDLLFRSLDGHQQGIDQFFGVLTGSVREREFLAPGPLIRTLGLRTTLRLLATRG